MASSQISLALHAGTLIVVYSVYGVLQEKILRSSTYGADEERFTSSALLILCNRLFSIAVGLLILLIKSRQSPSSRAGGGTLEWAPSFAARLRPASPVYAYAAVAVFNFLSTTCQYEALKYVSYTTQSLAKCAKMCPVLVVGAIVYKKKYLPKEWAAGATILVGCAAYLFSQPPRASSLAAAPTDDDYLSGLIGAFFLLGYLFFDGLVSTTQERVFGKNPSSSDPFGPDSPVLDQMIWTNAFAALIAVGSALLSNVSGTLLPNLRLLLTTPALVWDVSVFSAASAFGLIVLLNTIASFGALTTSLIMTTRQFLSILINAGLFGNFNTVGVQGWIGVGWVASGIYIKMDRSFDAPKSDRPSASDAVAAVELKGLAADEDEDEGPVEPIPRPAKQYLKQYLIPLVVPLVLALAASPFLDLDDGSDSLVAIEGGRWDIEMHDVIAPVCSHNTTTEPYHGDERTGFVSFPRSGNSYLRSLVERATGYQTSSIYCDKGLRQTFLGECDHETNFFVKTHFPSLPRKYDVDSIDYYKEFDRVVHLIRNPLDSCASWWHLSHVPKTAAGFQDHEARVEMGKFGDEERVAMLDLARRWRDHALYWEQAPILTHTLRYEDLKATPIPNMMSLISYLLPSEDLPSLTDMACMVETDHTREAYASRRNSDFATWDSWEPDLRREMLEITRRPFCSYGYPRLLLANIGAVEEMEGFCDGVEYGRPQEEWRHGAD